MEYFSHDYSTRSDEKIKHLIRRHGMAGYGIYWSIVEDLYLNANALRSDCDGIAYDLRVHCDVVRSVLYDFDLFVHNGEKFSSNSVQRRLDQRNEKSIKASKSARYRWENANAMRPHSERNAIKEIKEKEIKVKEIKEKNNKELVRAAFAAPTIEEVAQYAQGQGIGKLDTPEAFHDYYTANGWKVGRNPMKDWRAAFRKWTRTEKNNTNGTYQQQNEKSLSSRRKGDIDAIRVWGQDIIDGRVGISDIFGSTEA